MTDHEVEAKLSEVIQIYKTATDKYGKLDGLNSVSFEMYGPHSLTDTWTSEQMEDLRRKGCAVGRYGPGFGPVEAEAADAKMKAEKKWFVGIRLVFDLEKKDSEAYFRVEKLIIWLKNFKYDIFDDLKILERSICTKSEVNHTIQNVVKKPCFDEIFAVFKKYNPETKEEDLIWKKYMNSNDSGDEWEEREPDTRFVESAEINTIIDSPYEFITKYSAAIRIPHLFVKPYSRFINTEVLSKLESFFNPTIEFSSALPAVE